MRFDKAFHPNVTADPPDTDPAFDPEGDAARQAAETAAAAARIRAETAAKAKVCICDPGRAAACLPAA